MVDLHDKLKEHNNHYDMIDNNCNSNNQQTRKHKKGKKRKITNHTCHHQKNGFCFVNYGQLKKK